MTQPRALFLADVLEYIPDKLNKEAAAELRRLHEENERCRKICKATSECWRADAAQWQAQRDVLLEALKEIVDAADGTGWDQLDASFSKARAAIAKAEEKA